MNEADTDKDGISDAEEGADDKRDTDGDGTLNCDDDCPTDPFKIAEGECGCGVPDTDSDSASDRQ